MSAPEPATMVIACPHCGTRYEVARAAIGAAGRQVQCAHCQKAWQATPVTASAASAADAPLSGAVAEAAMDEDFAAEERRELASKVAAANRSAAEKSVADAHQRTLEEIKRAVAPRTDLPATAAAALDSRQQRKSQRAFFRRQLLANRRLPIARLRRTARIVAVVALTALLGGGVLLRTSLVGQFPALAGLYAGLGLPVNVVGLDFRNLRTLKSLQQGAEVLAVDADIFSVSPGEVKVPPVIVTLVGADGNAVYQWSVTPKASELEAGEVVGFESTVTAPPAGAERVKLSFGTGATAGQTGALAPQIPNPGKTP